MELLRQFQSLKDVDLESSHTLESQDAGAWPTCCSDSQTSHDGDGVLLCDLAEQFARASVPEEIVDVLRMGRITALQKPSGGVRGIVVGDSFRRLVSRTIAQQLRIAVEEATAPFQYAFTTRSGGECVAHAVQALTEADPSNTILSVDGVGAFDLVSGAMMSGLLRMDGGGAVLPFVRQFYGRPSSYLWDDEDGQVHEIVQGEDGEQGDPLMPALFALGQHAALVAVQDTLLPSEKLFAFLDDIYAVVKLERVAEVHASLERDPHPSREDAVLEPRGNRAT